MSGIVVHSRDHKSITLTLPTPAATDALGAALAECLRPGLLVRLDGDLGAGKTALVRAALRQLGHAGPVKSPTYALVELYKTSRLCLYHFDFYRFTDPEEFVDAGLAEYFRDDVVCCVEWPEKAGDHLPTADLAVRLAVAGGGGVGRSAHIDASGVRGLACLSCLSDRLPPTAS